MARSVPVFVAGNTGNTFSFQLVIRCEAGTSGTERRAMDEPTIPSRVRRNAFPEDGARLGLPPIVEPVDRSRLAREHASRLRLMTRQTAELRVFEPLQRLYLECARARAGVEAIREVAEVGIVSGAEARMDAAYMHAVFGDTDDIDLDPGSGA